MSSLVAIQPIIDIKMVGLSSAANHDVDTCLDRIDNISIRTWSILACCGLKVVHQYVENVARLGRK